MNEAKEKPRCSKVVQGIDREFRDRYSEGLYFGKQWPAALQTPDSDVVPTPIEISHESNELSFGSAMKEAVSEQKHPGSVITVKCSPVLTVAHCFNYHSSSLEKEFIQAEVIYCAQVHEREPAFTTAETEDLACSRELIGIAAKPVPDIDPGTHATSI
jgi:hypothetical protein